MKRFIHSFYFAGRGIASAFEDQLNLKIQLVLAAGVVALGFYFGVSGLEWCCLLLAVGLVISLEMINTCIEKAVDLVTQDVHPLAAKAKDIAAGAVLIAALVSVAVGWIVLGPHVIAWWQSW